MLNNGIVARARDALAFWFGSCMLLETISSSLAAYKTGSLAAYKTEASGY